MTEMTIQEFRAAVLNEVLSLIDNKRIVVDGLELIVTIDPAGALTGRTRHPSASASEKRVPMSGPFIAPHHRDRNRTRHRGTRRGAAPPPTRAVDPRSAHAQRQSPIPS
jgi:hypothetical protein